MLGRAAQDLGSAKGRQKLGIEGDLVDALLNAAKHVQDTGKSFPDSADRPQQVLDQEVPDPGYPQHSMAWTVHAVEPKELTKMSDNVHIHVANPESNQKQESNYEPSDVEQAFKDFHPASWQDLINELKKKGDSQWHLTPGEVKGMVADARQAAQSGAPFHAGQPDQVCREMQQHRARG